MKVIKFLSILLPMALFACATSHKQMPVDQELVPGWKLGYENLDILGAALAQKSEASEYALHSVGDSMLTANMIVYTWHFSWQDRKYEIMEGDSYIKAQHRMGPMYYYKTLDYTVYLEEDDKFVMELETVESPDGEFQFHVRPEGAGIAIDIFDMGETTQKVYSELPAQYGYSNSKLKSLANGAEFSYCTFDSDTMDIVTFTNKVIREDDILKVLSKQENDGKTETHLNQAAEVVYMSSAGLKFVKCDIDTALEERK